MLRRAPSPKPHMLVWCNARWQGVFLRPSSNHVTRLQPPTFDNARPPQAISTDAHNSLPPLAAIGGRRLRGLIMAFICVAEHDAGAGGSGAARRRHARFVLHDDLQERRMGRGQKRACPAPTHGPGAIQPQTSPNFCLGRSTLARELCPKLSPKWLVSGPLNSLRRPWPPPRSTTGHEQISA
jgi:hypothetical protein